MLKKIIRRNFFLAMGCAFVISMVPQWANSECGPLTVQYGFRSESPQGVQAQSFIDAVESVVGTVTELPPPLPPDVINKIKNADGINAFIALPGAGGSLPGVLADTYNNGIPFNFNAQQHVAWLTKHGGMELQQAQTDAAVGPGVVVLPVALGAAEHGLFFKTDNLPDGVLPEDLADAQDLFDGRQMRLFGHGGRLMAACFNVIQFNTITGRSPYQLMMDYGSKTTTTINNQTVFVDDLVLGVDFVTPVGDLLDMFDQPGMLITNSETQWTCDTTTEADDPGAVLNPLVPFFDDPQNPGHNNNSVNPCPDVAELGYATFYADGWHQNIGNTQNFFVDADWWNSCTPKQQSAIKRLAKANMLNGRAEEIAQTSEALNEIEARISDQGGHFVNGPWPSAILDHLAECAVPFFEELASSNAAFGEIFQSMNDFKEYKPNTNK